MGKNLIIVSICTTIALWFWALHDITRSNFKRPLMRTVSLITVIIIPTIGSLAYLVLRNSLVTKEKRKFRPNFKKSNTTSKNDIK